MITSLINRLIPSYQLFCTELRAILSNSIVMMTLGGGVVFYSFLYPLPYLQQTPKEQNVGVVNLDQSTVSLKFERMVDATPQVKIQQHYPSIQDAKEGFLSGDIRGILVIPEHFYRDLLRGVSPTLAYAGDASYFLVYGTIMQGLAQAGGTLAAGVKISQDVRAGQAIPLARQQYTPFTVNMKPSFNPRMGYLDYIIPAVFLFILQQTLIMAMGLFTASQRLRIPAMPVPSFASIGCRCFIFTSFYYLLFLYYFGASFKLYGISQLANIGWLITFVLPFFITNCFIGLILGMLVPRQELVSVTVLMSAMPLLFSGGFVWPIESLPEAMVWLSQAFPSAAAISGCLRLNQMAADWPLVLEQWLHLWYLSVIWGSMLILICIYKRKNLK